MLLLLGDSSASPGYTVLLCSGSRIMLLSCSCKLVREGQSFVTRVTITCVLLSVFSLRWKKAAPQLDWGVPFKHFQTVTGTHGLDGQEGLCCPAVQRLSPLCKQGRYKHQRWYSVV